MAVLSYLPVKAITPKYFVLAILSAFLLRILLRAFVTPLRNIPGPFLARFSRLWKVREYYRGAFEKRNIELHRRHGAIVRVAPNEYSIDDPEAVKAIYGHGSQFTKSDWYYAAGRPNAHRDYDIFSELDNKRHATTRRKVTATYAMSALVQMEPFLDECSALLIDRFTQFTKSGEVIDLGHWLQCYAFDVIGQVTFAKRFGFLEAGNDIGGIMAAIDVYLLYLSHVGIYPFLHPFLSKIVQAVSPKDSGLGYVTIFSQTQIAARLDSNVNPQENNGKDFLTKLLALHADDPSKVTMWDILMTCGTNIGAGSDTTAISLSAVLYHLFRNPNTLGKLRSEIDEMARTMQISNAVSFQEAQAMPYLQAVLKEALRMHPATGFPLERAVPKGGVMIAGRFFSEGSVVGINSWVAHANTNVFGHDAHLFRPERWLVSKEEYNRMDSYFMAFGLGSRTCIGKNISLMEMSKIIPQLLRNFDFDISVGSNELKTSNRWFVKPVGFKCRVSLRRI